MKGIIKFNFIKIGKDVIAETPIGDKEMKALDNLMGSACLAMKKYFRRMKIQAEITHEVSKD